jgi:hypothetical protein
MGAELTSAPGRRPGSRLTRPELKASYFPTLSLAYHLHALPERHLIYVKNPKAACSTVLLWLHRLHTGDHGFSPDNVHVEHGIPRPGEIGWRQVMGMLSGDAYRFSFVRNPLHRLESSYRDKIVNSDGWREKVQATLGGPVDPGSPVTFDQFLSALEQQDPVSEMDPHWRPQHVNLMHPLVRFDRVGHVETFDRDLETIRSEADLPEVPLEVRNVSRTKDWDSVYAGRPDRVRRVEAIYATDFELYGY